MQLSTQMKALEQKNKERKSNLATGGQNVVTGSPHLKMRNLPTDEEIEDFQA